MVALFTPKDGWMHFPKLDGLSNVAGVYALTWRFTDQAGETWTDRVNRFKAGNKDSIAGAEKVLHAAVPKLILGNGWNPNETAVSVALSSPDTGLVPSKPLPKIIAGVCAKNGLKWMPSLLAKRPHQPLHTCRSQAEREEQIKKADYSATGALPGIKRVLVFDDIATRGDTFTAIATAIKKLSPRLEVIGAVLGKSERASYAATWGHNIDNNHVPWENHWNGK